jgi:hypothetical protein
MLSETDVLARRTDSRFLAEQAAALVTAFVAAMTAFSLTIPGQSRQNLRLLFGSAAVWTVLLLVGMFVDWRAVGSAGLAIRTDWPCVGGILAGAGLPALFMIRMLRNGAPFTPRMTMTLAALAATAVPHVAMCVVESHPTNMTVAVWHGLTIAAVVAVAAAAGRMALGWPVFAGKRIPGIR